MRTRLTAVLVCIVAATSAVLGLAAAGTAAADPQPRYAVAQPVCGVPAPGHATCFAMRAVAATADTPGAFVVHASDSPDGLHAPGGGLTPAAIAKAYGLNPGIDRHGQTVALVDWFDQPHIRADLNHFDAHYGLPAETTSSFRKVNGSGASSPLPAPGHLLGVEISLDVEAVRAVCHTCHIVLVEASTSSSVALAGAVNTAARLGATEISNSYGAFEQRGRAFSSNVRAAYFHPGVVVTASTGDDGWYGWDLSNGQPRRAPNATAFPGTSPGVVSVGGTKLALSSSGARVHETVWNNDGLDNSYGKDHGPSGATGSGCSVEFPAPSWQLAAPAYRVAGCAGKRFTSDVSALGDPNVGFGIYDSYGERGWLQVGGTSLSSPLIAGMWALAQGSGGIAYPAQALYQNFNYHRSAIYDVTSGGSSWCGGDTTAHCMSVASSRSNGATNNPNDLHGSLLVDCSFPASGRLNSAPSLDRECNAAVGIDGPTGVGTPRGTALFGSPTPVVTIYRPAVPTAGAKQSYRAKVVDPAGRVKRYEWHWGDNRGPTVTTMPSAKHAYLHKGTYSMYLEVHDSAGQVVDKFRTIYVTH